MIGAGPAPAQSYGIVGAEQYFTLDWEAKPGSSPPVVAGNVANSYGRSARNVRLYVEGLDGSGNVVSTTIGYVAGALTPGARAYFEVPVPTGAVAYRVKVLSFDWLVR